MCYYKLDYYDVSSEILAAYLQAYPDSAIAINLKACNHFRLYNGKTAENELRILTEKGVNIQQNDLIKHNLVVFASGEQAPQVSVVYIQNCVFYILCHTYHIFYYMHSIYLTNAYLSSLYSCYI